MIEISRWILNRIDIVLVLPFLTSGVCLFVHHILKAAFNARIAVFIVSALSLAGGYWFAFICTFDPLINVFILAPQALILMGMAGTILAISLLRPGRKAPSLWWVVLVAAIGHAWTRLWLYAIAGAV